MNKFLPIAHVLGMMLIVFSVTIVMPLAAAVVYQDGTLRDFAYSSLVTLIAGLLLWFFTRRFKGDLKPRDGYLLVVLGWILMAAIATLPLMLHIDGLSFTDAFFETMSGLSTTGATVLTGLDRLPPAINLWRHELNWLGGMGIIVLAVAILPMLGVGGMQIFKAEAPGPFKDSKLTPRIAETAKALWYVYTGITVVCILALKWAGMNWLDAICHAFAAMGLGGFSTHDASVGYFDSPLIEFILITFMLIAGMNFATHFIALHGRSLRIYLKDAEAKAFLALTISSCFAVALFLWGTGTYPSFLVALRHTSFNLVSLATDCGFASVDFNQWPIFASLAMLFLSCVSVSSGSSGGGIKMVRTLVLVKQAKRELTLLIHPNAVTQLRIGNTVIPEHAVVAVLGFIFLYFMSIVVLTFVLMASGLDFLSSFTAIIACINNAGPGLNQVGPASNFGVLSELQTWVCSFAMLLGRLEVLTLLVLFTPGYWRK